MFMRTIGRRGIKPFIVCALTVAVPFAVPLAAGETPVASDTDSGPKSASEAAAPSSEIEQLRRMILDQQRQIDELKRAMADQRSSNSTVAAKPDTAVASAPSNGIGEIASTAPILPPIPALTAAVVPLPAPQAAVAAPSDALQKAIDAINGNLRGFRLSGDFRLRFDTLNRSANTSLPPSDNRAVPMQRDRERYRVRINIDKDLFYKDGADRSLATFHLQLATDPFNNPNTMDTDFAALATRAPISIAEAYMEFKPTKGLALRAGRTAELYADNRQFVYDDDIRFNGFHETYRWNGKKAGFYVQLAAAQYILTDPNIQVTPAGSPFLAAGYSVGQRIPSSGFFDQGLTIGSNLGKKWSHNETVNYFAVREPNQIQLASTTGGAALFANNPVVGATLISNLGETGNATTTPGGATYFASAFHVIRGAFNLNYSGSTLMKHNFPFALFVQTTHNTGASFDNDAYMAGWSLGQAARLGDIQFQYQYFYKPANAFVSQFTDDDIGTGTGVNLKGHEIRVNFGLTRFLAWENRLYIMNGVSRSDPSINFFVPLQQGYNTQLRLHSQFVFTF
jgi:hypothetical protein